MTHILLYWNHICVLHRQERIYLSAAQRHLQEEGIDLEIRCFGLGYPEHMSVYLSRPDAVLPDMILSADLEVYEDPRIYQKLEPDLYETAGWLPLRSLPPLPAVFRSPRLLPVAAIPLVYYTRDPGSCTGTALSDWNGLAFGGINNSAAKTVIKSVWERCGKDAASSLLDRSMVTDMPIGAFQAVKTGQTSTALVPSLYALRADGRQTHLLLPMEGPVLIPSYLCARRSAPEWAARRVTQVLLNRELCDFYVSNGDLILYPDRTDLHSRQETAAQCCPTGEWLSSLDPEEFYRLYCAHLPTAINPFA